MTDAIEAVARALVKNRGFDWDSLPDRPKWGHLENRDNFREQAKAAIAAYQGHFVEKDMVLMPRALTIGSGKLPKGGF